MEGSHLIKAKFHLNVCGALAPEQQRVRVIQHHLKLLSVEQTRMRVQVWQLSFISQ